MNATLLGRWARPGRWPIGAKLLAGFGLILLFTLGLAAISFSSLLSVQRTVNRAIEEGVQIEILGNRAQNAFSNARRQEQAFLLYWEAEGYQNAVNKYLIPHGNHLSDFRQTIVQLDSLTTGASEATLVEINGQANDLSASLESYRTEFNATITLLRERGDSGSGAIGELEDTEVKLEDGIRALAQPELLNRYLSLQLSVTQYRLAGESRYRDEAGLASAELRTTLLADTAPADTKRLVPLLDQYEAAFNELVRLDDEIRHHTDLYNTAAATIQPLTLGIAADGAALASENLNSMAESVQRARTGLALSITVVVMLSLLLTITLSRQISRPLRALTDAVIQIGRGNLNAPLPKAGHDEVGILTTTFHDMMSQLRESFATLEQRVADRTRALALSSEISRRLSGLLDQKQLISEVVEQVRSTFNYYHAHIYLYDPKHEHLVMSGGTGEAARAMLARGHRIEEGRGLVGRAAATNAPVLVPDVSKDPGWLPNPLLPDTKAEVAVPIAIGGRVLGVLDVQHNVREGLKQDDVELLQSIAFQVAIALQNARSYEQAQRQADRETLINTVTQRIQNAGDIEGVLQIAARELGQALGAQRATAQIGMPKIKETRRA